MGLGLGTAETPDRAVVWYDFFLIIFPASGGWHVLAVWCLVGGNMSMQQKRAALASDLGLPAGHWSALLPALEAE